MLVVELTLSLLPPKWFSHSAKGIKGDTTAIGAGDMIQCNRCNGTQVYRAHKGNTWMPGRGWGQQGL
jgi:hypothetical protein